MDEMREILKLMNDREKLEACLIGLHILEKKIYYLFLQHEMIERNQILLASGVRVKAKNANWNSFRLHNIARKKRKVIRKKRRVKHG